MKRIIVLAAFSMVVNLGACQSPAGNKTNTITPVAFMEKSAAAGVQLVDVRSADEYAEGHLANAINIDVNGDNFKVDIAKLDKAKPVMVYCHSGRRSAKAAAQLEEAGFKEIYNLDGGITAWQQAGKPVVRGGR